jgi:hypothetical protein
MGRRRLSSLAVTVAALVGLVACSSGAAAADLLVDGGSAVCSDARTAAQAGSAATPWCSLGRAAREAGAGDTVHVLPATYRETLRPARSGTPAAPLRFLAASGTTIDAAGAANAVSLIGRSDVVIDGFAVRGGSAQGIWIDSSARVSLTALAVTGSAGAGTQVKASSGVRIERSTIAGNGGAGIMELAGTSGARYSDDTISDNGRGGSAYNGDGIQLGGSGALIERSTIAGNGDPGPYELRHLRGRLLARLDDRGQRSQRQRWRERQGRRRPRHNPRQPPSGRPLRDRPERQPRDDRDHRRARPRPRLERHPHDAPRLARRHGSGREQHAPGRVVWLTARLIGSP